jgi:hypothetical protein
MQPRFIAGESNRDRKRNCLSPRAHSLLKFRLDGSP